MSASGRSSPAERRERRIRLAWRDSGKSTATRSKAERKGSWLGRSESGNPSRYSMTVTEEMRMGRPACCSKKRWQGPGWRRSRSRWRSIRKEVSRCTGAIPWGRRNPRVLAIFAANLLPMGEDLAGGQAFRAQSGEFFQDGGSGMGRSREDGPTNNGRKGFALTELSYPQFFVRIYF